VIAIEPITPANIPLFKQVRLRALQDSPSAFGSTFAREAQFTEAEWLHRVTRWNGEKGIGFLALDVGAPCGIAGALLHDNDATQATLVSMWTAPTHRKQGIARRLVEEVQSWARTRNVQTLILMVTSKNEPAKHFYERLGFTYTGRTEPYPNDTMLFELEMSIRLTNAGATAP
jgi:ribosomal protein S18 acetylase RimI-like enzyme